MLLRFLLGMVVCASATSGLGLQIVLITIVLVFKIWCFYVMYMKGELNEN